MPAVVDVAFSDLVNKPVATVRRLMHARAIRLRRRGDEDLVLISAADYQQQRAVFATAAQLFASLARSHSYVLSDLLPELFPWVKFLPDDEQRHFAKELTTTLRASSAIDNMTPTAQLIAEWRHTAEAYADPAVYAALTSDGEDFGPVPQPTGAGQ